MYVYRGSQIYASVNVESVTATIWSGIATSLIFAAWQSKAQQTLAGLPSHLQVVSSALSPDNGNITVNLIENMDRNDVQDIASDLAIAAQRAGFTVRGQMAAVKVAAAPGAPQPPGTVPPGAGTVDTYHDDETIVGNTVEFYGKVLTQGIADQLKGLGVGVNQLLGVNIDPTLVGVGILAVVALFVLKK